MLTLAAEDEFVILAIHGGKEVWWNIKWACDVAAFIDARDGLDWEAILGRARAQGCLRMVLLAVALAQGCFQARVPAAVAALVAGDPAIRPMVERIVRRWQAPDPSDPEEGSALSLDRMRLHDGVVRRLRFAARSLILPGPHYIASLALPRRLAFAYIPLKLANDLAVLPLLQAWRYAQARVWRRVPAVMPPPG